MRGGKIDEPFAKEESGKGKRNRIFMKKGTAWGEGREASKKESRERRSDSMGRGGRVCESFIVGGWKRGKRNHAEGKEGGLFPLFFCGK